jgi:ABC-type Mn2+/Zn2+ transport system permease subunit
MFTEPFMQRALLAATCLAPLCALLGVFVTARRLAFFSDTVSHAALVGVSLGFLLGFREPTLPLLAVSLLVAATVFWLRRHTELTTDTIMALLLSGSVALGIIILSLLEIRPGEVHRYLFGDILAIGPGEVVLAALLSTVVTVGLFRDLSPLSLLTLNEDLAHVCGVSVRRLNCIFVIVLTLTVAMSIRLLGILLVTALIVIPPATARNLSRNLRQQLLLSMVSGLAGGWGGMGVAYQLDVPCGPAIVLVCAALFLLSLAVSRFLRRQPAPPQVS